MSHVDDRITRPIAVPSYLVYGALTLIAVLSGGPIGQLVMVSHHVYELQARMADTEREHAAAKVKQDDILTAMKAMSTEIHDITRSIAVLNSKMP